MEARFARAYILAARFRSSAGTPEIFSTNSGVYFSTTCRKASKFSVRPSTKALSERFSARITFISPFRTATSVPGFWRSQMSAYFVRVISRGSMTTSFVLCWRTARFTTAPMTGWFSVVFVPVARMQSVYSSSAMEFVMAPLPNAAARPATVTECQSRAQ